jgi:hypothetical protein
VPIQPRRPNQSPLSVVLSGANFHTVGLIEELDDELLRNNRIRGARRS